MTQTATHAPGEKNLNALIASMTPVMDENRYVFATLSDLVQIPVDRCEMQFRESEGISLILTKADARAYDLAYVYPCRKITLTVQSSLEAIGFLAAITARLAAAQISVNAVSAYYHDHLFVPADRAQDAMEILHAMSSPA